MDLDRNGTLDLSVDVDSNVISFSRIGFSGFNWFFWILDWFFFGLWTGFSFGFWIHFRPAKPGLLLHSIRSTDKTNIQLWSAGHKSSNAGF